MSVLAINGQSNAVVVLNGLLHQHGLPTLSPEGIDALSAKFQTGLVIGNGVISHDGRPLIDELQAIHADPETRGRFFEAAEHGPPAAGSNLTESWRAEIAASRKQSMPTDFHQVRSKYAANSLTARMMDEVAAARRASK
jgi:hypothetical protein